MAAVADELSLDFETWCDLNLKEVGTSRYARHHSAEVLMAAWAINDGPIKQWRAAEGEPIPAELDEALDAPGHEIEKWAFNAPFEMAITRYTLGRKVIVPSWRDTMVQALHCSLPGSLEKVAPVLNLDAEMQKNRRGKALMRKFSIPRKPTKNDPSIRKYWHELSDEWEEYLEYNRDDVKVERAVRKRLKPYLMSQEEWELWFLDHRINWSGLPINSRMVGNAIRVYEDVMDTALTEMHVRTGLANPNSLKQLLPWLQSEGYMFDDCVKGHIRTARRYFDEKPDHWGDNYWTHYKSNENLKRVLDLRLQTSRTSIKKYHALQKAVDDDGMLRNVLQMNGAARTGRYGGRAFQPQNLPRPEKRFEDYQETLADGLEHLDSESLELIHGNVFDVLASGIRTSAQAPEGKMLIDADLSAIENRVLGWIAGCDKILDVFRRNQDPYIAFATFLYNTPYEDLYHEYKVEKNGAKRTIAKPGTLGCGYGMGAGKVFENEKTGEIEATGLTGYAWNMGVKHFTLEDSQHSVDTFRTQFKEVVDYWYALERAMRRCVKTGKPQEHGVIRFDRKGPFLRMILPSGRPLHYLRPRLEMVPVPWGGKKLQITYEGQNDKKQWVRQHTTPGKITENADQAISRDLLVHGMKLAAKEGIDTRLHVHDQLVAVVNEDDADEKLKVLIECMEDEPWWAKGLPLGSEGITTRVFKKD